MIVEFSGVPGSGKSTIYNKLNKDMKNIVFISNNKFSLLNEICLLIYFLLNFSKTRRYLYLFKVVTKSKNTFWHKVNIIRNIIKKISKYMIYKDKKGIFIFDEGISHISFNLFVDDTTNDVLQREVKKALRLLPLPNVLFFIEADKSLVIDRLKNRGHKRINLNNVEETENFVNKAFQVKSIITEEFKKNIEIIEILNNNIDTTKVVEMIFLKLKDIDV